MGIQIEPRSLPRPEPPRLLDGRSLFVDLREAPLHVVGAEKEGGESDRRDEKDLVACGNCQDRLSPCFGPVPAGIG